MYSWEGFENRKKTKRKREKIESTIREEFGDFLGKTLEELENWRRSVKN